MLWDKHEEFMRAAIKEARQGESEGGIPIGAVLVRDGVVIGRGHNRRVQQNDPVLHAEINCMRNAGRQLTYKDCILYTTLFPCYMCAGAIVQFGIQTVIVGDSTSFAGAADLLRDHWVNVIDLEIPECREMMRHFITTKPSLWNEDIGTS